MEILFTPLTSLDRVWPDACPAGCEPQFCLLRNEAFSFQAAFRGEGMTDNAVDAFVTLETDFPGQITLRKLGYVPVLRPLYARSDDNYPRSAPGLYPDPLMPVPEGRVRLLPTVWQSLWITLNPDGLLTEAGTYAFTLRLTAENAEAVIRGSFTVPPAVLPKQPIPVTNWLHCDCIADRYGCEVFSERFWTLLDSYLAGMPHGGQNMVLTPCFTPPLDTPVGGERRTVQLVDVTLENGQYRFDFGKLRRFIALCRKHGIEYFEHSHLFTQWGAEHAPKVMATVDGRYRRLFGWETDATGDGYRVFLTAYLTALKPLLEETGVGKRMFFHISDEPQAEHLPRYKAAGELIRGILEGYTIFDALSHYEYFEQGLVNAPVAVTSAIEAFLGRCPSLWAYYCGGQTNDNLSNRLIADAPERNRVLGIQLYRHRIQGFLHWGYNFWYTTLSRAPFDPFLQPDADGHFVGGTSFLVYPGAEGPIESVRLLHSGEAMQDFRALTLLESLAGRDAADALLERHFPGLDFHTCPENPAQLLALRQDLYTEITKYWN